MVDNGNAKVNAIYEFNIPKTLTKPSPVSSRYVNAIWWVLCVISSVYTIM
jgi:hypothetical protein